MFSKDDWRRWTKKFRRKFGTVRRLWPIALPGILMIGVGALLLERYHASMTAKLLGLFSSELGFACLISAIIFAIMEEWAAREHGKTAIGHLYGVRPVGHFFEKIEKHVLKQRFYRDITIVTYAFEQKEGENLLVRYHVEYIVRNMCTDDEDDYFLPRGSLTKTPLHTEATGWDGMLGVHEVKLDGAPIAITRTDDASTRNQSYQADKRKRLARGQTAKVEATHYLIKHDHDSAVWTTSMPSRRAELHLLWEDGMDLEFVADPIHPEPGQLGWERDVNRLVLKVDEPFLIGHGFHFWWSSKARGTAAAAPVPQGPA